MLLEHRAKAKFLANFTNSVESLNSAFSSSQASMHFSVRSGMVRAAKAYLRISLRLLSLARPVISTSAAARG
jgi:hypothetical protein